MRLLAVVEYDGTEFCGFQRQQRPRQGASEQPRTVQAVIETAIAAATGEPVGVTAAGRTDSGVHAAGQVVHFDLVSPMTSDLSRLQRAVNAHLPRDVALRAAARARPDFHARYSAVSRRYCYRIVTAAAPSPLLCRFAYHVRRPLDVKRMAQAATALVGEHDFVAFAAQEGTEQTRRAVLRAEVTEQWAFAPGIWQNVMQHNRAHAADRAAFDTPLDQPPGSVRMVTVEVEANAFLRHMMRRIAGTLIRAGSGRIEPEEVTAILAGGVKQAAGPAAPAHGLCLQQVQYRPDDMLGERTAATRRGGGAMRAIGAGGEDNRRLAVAPEPWPEP